MTTEQIKQAHSASPFVPFTIHMGDGRSFRVDHPEFLARSPTGRTVVVYNHSNEAFSVLDLLLMTELEVHGTPPSPALRSQQN